ncbi:MAG: pyruvate kinase [Salinirussus sp.]
MERDTGGDEPTHPDVTIVCTLGPASEDRGTIRQLARAGMSVARLNASHGTPEDRRRLVERIREVDEERERPLASLLDLSGPEVRTVPGSEPVRLEPGAELDLATGVETGPGRIGLTESVAAARPGDTVLIDDGRIETTVVGSDDGVTVRVDTGGVLERRAGVNVPGVDLGLPVVTETDRRDLDLAAETGVDFVAASFVRSKADVYEVSAALEDRGADIPVVAKIERADAVENLQGIVEAADGVMVARGDLGVECPLEDVPIIQKRIIRRCHRAGVPVITATEMLDSMVSERRPTRAEASDVANAVLDGTDAVMLSAETAVGDHPIHVVETMTNIVADVEGTPEYDEAREQRVPPPGDTPTDALARSARFLARDVDASAIVAASESGYTARKAAKYRPSIPVIAATPNERVRRQLTLPWGTIPTQATEEARTADGVIRASVQAAIRTGVAESGDTVVVLAGMMTDLDGDTTNMLKLHVAAERLAAGRSVVPGSAVGPIYHVDSGTLDGVPDGAVLAVPDTFDEEFPEDLSGVAGIVDEHAGVTGYAAIVARELGIPMISDVDLPALPGGTSVSLDAERGVLYADPASE